MAQWIDLAQDVHSLYRELLSVGSSIMRVEDHLTMGIPGAREELVEARQKLLDLTDKAGILMNLVEPAGVNDGESAVGVTP